MIDKTQLRQMYITTNGKQRVLYTYASDNLKKQHKAYLLFINDYFYPSRFSHAYSKKRSIYTNAIVHLKNDIFIKIDVKNFFPSLNHHFLCNELFFELNKKYKKAVTLKECKSIVENSSVSRTGLPLGLIPSPVLSNIYMKRFDGLLYGQLKQLGDDTFRGSVRYSRYADDIFISFKTLINGSELELLKKAAISLCKKELERCHLEMNTSKTRVVNLRTSNHFKMAGINIIKTLDGKRRLTVGRKIIKQHYFDALMVEEHLRTKPNDGRIRLSTQQVKGMHSFLFSVEKKGYSHILSDKMREEIKARGYDSLEEMIELMKA